MPSLTKPLVGIFTRPIDQGTSGSGRHLHELVRRILALNDEFDIRLIHYVRTDRDVYTMAPEILVPRNPLRAAAALRGYGFKILHYSPLTVMSPILGLPVKRAATIHGAEPNLLPEYYSLQARLHARYAKPALARAMDRIFTVSETSKAYYAREWGVDPAKVSVCYNAVGPAYKPGLDPCPILARLGVGGRYIFHISKYSERKNPDCLLRAFAELAGRADMADLSLVIAGSGWDNERVRSFIAARGLEGRVALAGFSAEADAAALFSGAAAFAFPSRAEGFGMPNVEAMASGCPVVTSRAFAIPEIVGDAALLIDHPDDYRGLASALAEILTKPALADELRLRGLKRAARYSWEESARTVLSGYRALLS